MRRMTALGVLLAGFLAVTANGFPADAMLLSEGHDRVAFGQTITIEEGDLAGDIVCAFCTVRARGDVSGDVVTFFGTVELGEGKTISGDAVSMGGGLTLKDKARVGGDLVVFGGDLEQASTATVSGDRVVFAGMGWLLVLLIPLAIPVGVIWFIVWLIRRPRYRFPAYPGGRY